MQREQSLLGFFVASSSFFASSTATDGNGESNTTTWGPSGNFTNHTLRGLTLQPNDTRALERRHEKTLSPCKHIFESLNHLNI